MDIEIIDSQSFKEYMDANNLVFVDFYTTWCEPCKLLDQILDRILSKMPEGMKLLKLDSDEFPELAENLQIKSAPVLFIFRDGKEVWRMNGFMMDDDLLKIMHDVSRETSD